MAKTNQYRIHRIWNSLWTIAKIAWVQSKNKKIEMIGVVVDRSVIPMIDIDIDKRFDDTINDPDTDKHHYNTPRTTKKKRW